MSLNRPSQIVARLLEQDREDRLKDLALALTTNPNLKQVKCVCPFTNVSAPVGPYAATPHYFSMEERDWVPEWEKGTAFPLSAFVKEGVLDLYDLPHGAEKLIEVNPDGSPGPTISFSQFEVTDSDPYKDDDEDDAMYF